VDESSCAVDEILTLAPAAVNLLELIRIDGRKLIVAAVAIHVRVLVGGRTITLLSLSVVMARGAQPVVPGCTLNRVICRHMGCLGVVSVRYWVWDDHWGKGTGQKRAARRGWAWPSLYSARHSRTTFQIPSPPGCRMQHVQSPRPGWWMRAAVPGTGLATVSLHGECELFTWTNLLCHSATGIEYKKKTNFEQEQCAVNL